MVALADLALQPEGELVTLGELSRRQDISLPYLEQLVREAAARGLVTSVRGPGGGYRLARPATEIRVVEVLRRGGRDGGRDAQGRGRQRAAQSGSRAQSLTNRLWESLSGACLRVPAPDAAVGRGGQTTCPLSGGADAVRGGGRGLIPRAVAPGAVGLRIFGKMKGRAVQG
jgi:Rrf2 family iron-sulfur cluster assembly transcriptional regulator